MSYNGWTNYETWVTKLWLDNEFSTYSDVTDQAKQHTEAATASDEMPDPYSFADWLKQYTDETLISEEISGLASDLLRAAWSEIDWHEMAEAYLADAAEELAS